MFKSEPFCSWVEGATANFKGYGIKETSILLYGTWDHVRYNWVSYGNKISSEFLFGGKFEFWVYCVHDIANTDWPLHDIYWDHTTYNI